MEIMGNTKAPQSCLHRAPMYHQACGRGAEGATCTDSRGQPGKPASLHDGTQYLPLLSYLHSSFIHSFNPLLSQLLQAEPVLVFEDRELKDGS